MFRTQKRIKNPVKHLGWSYFCKKLHLRSLTRVLNMPLEYLKFNVIKKINLPLTKGARKGEHLRKNDEKQMLQERGGVL